jgi:hypothetical protein
VPGHPVGGVNLSPEAGTPWSTEEVDLTVQAYFRMLSMEVAGEPFSKAETRRGLLPLLPGRTHGALEYKFQNISAVLIEQGAPYVDGYKPAGNYQALLFDRVLEAFENAGDLQRAIGQLEQAPPIAPLIESFTEVLEDPPTREPSSVGEPVVRPRVGRSVDYLGLEAGNRALGVGGEEWVVRYERWRLMASSRPDLAGRVEHTARERGDGLGYDILSFESTGAERLIEVKTTKYGKYVPFFLSKTEVDVSRERESHYHLYRVFNYRKTPGLCVLSGALTRTCSLEPRTFLARPA